MTLRIQPHEKRSADERVFFHAPLGVIVEIDEQEACVIIDQAWIFRQH